MNTQGKNRQLSKYEQSSALVDIHTCVYIFFFLRMSVLFVLQKVPQSKRALPRVSHEPVLHLCAWSHQLSQRGGDCDAVKATPGDSGPRRIEVSDLLDSRTRHIFYHMRRELSRTISVANSLGRFEPNHKHVLGFFAATLGFKTVPRKNVFV